LYAIYLLENYQRQGIGNQLVRNVVQELHTFIIFSLFVWVLEDNPSRFFYERLGGQVIYEQVITIGGVQVKKVGYGWKDTRNMSL
jgi:GNAT superfamily N-acetyltransferase